ncbi:DUF115 domain-containing protein [Lysinibacillus sp. CD3-6]|uniref:motility associated factor glycosyltransferase family protein n=1 Tax=Lysinibacillus sp. CD3-6 TaxID=2892541 RepID=UPI00116B6018|nr:6-hydroxymethylpterin diphosphokinase MptE-like protein [Lysinibacillus sp. CD3-6]UED80924.1 DUF115 domain-containing protein [Lysinibacillus sp. CD3-6]
MQWQVVQAKNEEHTLQLNGVFIYSKYRPKEDALRWINAEFNSVAKSYVLIGLGLGYHLKALVSQSKNKPVTVYYFDKQEYELFLAHNTDLWWEQENIHIVHEFSQTELHDNVQILLPNVWIKGIGQSHPLFSILEMIKINQLSFKRDSSKMEENFYCNTILDDDIIQVKKQRIIGCIVAAGPSLDETIRWLKKYQHQVDIYVVGAALKKLLKNGIIPKGAILSDANDETILQFQDLNFDGELYYLCTANYKSVKLHGSKRYILFQQGYKLAEREAEKRNAPLIETGGSVGTTTFSLLEYLGYETVVLFGQDLGFSGNHTHATDSTSGRNASNSTFLRNIKANDGSDIHTTAMFQVFWYWYNQKMEKTKVKVFNTAIKGAKIKNVPLISEEEFVQLIKK